MWRQLDIYEIYDKKSFENERQGDKVRVYFTRNILGLQSEHLPDNLNVVSVSSESSTTIRSHEMTGAQTRL